MLPERSDVVVIGGGVMGAAALHYLAQLGCAAPVLVERETLASGSTGHCAGGVRTLFSDELNVSIGLESIRRLERFDADLGQPLDLRLWGYLFLLDDQADVARFEDDLALQARFDLGTRLLTPEEARRAVPQLEVGDLLAAVLCPVAGYVTPDLVVQGYARRAVERGAHIEQSCPAARILVEHGRVAGVETARGTIRADRVVLAAGVWSRELAATAGFDLPVTPERRHMWFTDDAPAFPRELPLTVDFSTGFYFHREGAALAFGGREQSLEELAPIAARRLPALEELGVRSSTSGFYELSPDHNALVGEAPAPAGLFYATGFSGHGFQQGPVIGEHLAELALGRPPTFDLRSFSVERFAGGEARVELNVV
ncbi:MAG TPA: FAD-binding oxidoreductase [Gaiellaceae bacterium]|nr:FAD-binding oxidoreductase [Gaiellaceae bacterium]